MYKVLIVDDESLVITSLKACADWESLGFTVAGEANDGVSAYESILAIKPDLVFTDIRMPGMSGLELIKKVISQLPHVHFIIISGYAEFAYVQKALSYGVMGYCLKPFDEVEITSLLVKAKAMLDKARVSVEMEMIGLINENDDISRQRLKNILDSLGLPIDGSHGLVAAVSAGSEKLSFPPEINQTSLKLGGNRYAYLFDGQHADAFRRHFQSENPPGVRGIGISKPRHDVGALLDAVDEATLAANQYFLTGRFGVYDLEENNQESINAAFIQLESAIIKRDIVAIQKTLDMLEGELAKGQHTVKNALKAYNIFMYSFYIVSEDKYENYLHDYDKLACSFQGVHDMFQFLRDLLKKYAGVSAGALPSSSRNDTFSNIIAYVNEHFCEDISIHTISKEFAVNPNYVSQLFKRQTDETFTEHITNLRVNFACTLLKTTDLSVSEVADRVGFSDYYYFTRVFKRLVGDTPSGYREKNTSDGHQGA